MIFKISLFPALILLLITTFSFHTLNAETPSHKNPSWIGTANAYEVNLRQFTEEGTVDAFSEHLTRLKEMGVDVLLFLPIYEIGEQHPKGSLGDFYNIRDFTSFNKEFGTLKSFKKMVKKAHKLGMHVVLDWEPKYVAKDHVWFQDHEKWFEASNAEQAILDYENEEMCTEMKDAMHFWVDKVGIDGYRCFHTNRVPLWFWEDIWMELEVKQPLLGISMEEDKSLFKAGFDVLMGNKLYNILEDMGKNGKGGEALMQYMAWRREGTQESDLYMNYITNYRLNSEQGPLRDRIGNRTKILTILTVILDGVPMIMNGQEAALSNALPCCEKSVIPWYSYIRASLFHKLFYLKHHHPALVSGKNGGKFFPIHTNSGGTVVVFMRKKGKDRILYEMNLEDRHYIFQFMDKVPEDQPMSEYFTNEAADFKDLNGQYTTAGRMEAKLFITKFE